MFMRFILAGINQLFPRKRFSAPTWTDTHIFMGICIPMANTQTYTYIHPYVRAHTHTLTHTLTYTFSYRPKQVYKAIICLLLVSIPEV